jgi:hypothetical protein
VVTVDDPRAMPGEIRRAIERQTRWLCAYITVLSAVTLALGRLIS